MIMTRINLLPWREELRQEQKKQFLMMVVMTFILSAAMVGLIHFQMQAKIDYQLSRNQFLSQEIAKVDEEIKEIRELRKVRRSLVERMEVIQDLESMTQTGGSLLINGLAESNARVSTYMRNLSDSEWLKDPNLTVIEIEDITVNRISNFTLTVKQTSPNATEEEEDDGGLTQ